MLTNNLDAEDARFMGEFVLLKNFPDAEIFESKIEEKLEINNKGVLVTSTQVYIMATLPTSIETITINFTIMN
jgi:hypothetical protein